MRPGPAAGASRGSARGGVAPALLLDVQTPSGDTYYWADRPLKNYYGTDFSEAASGFTVPVDYLPWLVGSGSLTFNRSAQTDTGTLTLQNMSGDVLQRDFERIAKKATLEGSLFVFRYMSIDMNHAWIEQHGTLSCTDAKNTVQLNLSQLFAGQDDTPEQTVVETCQLNWGQPRCGATGLTECLYTFASCQVPERFVGIQTAFEVNNPSATAALATQTINRNRAW